MSLVPESEIPHLTAHPTESIESYSRDEDFCADIRNALIMLDEDDAAILAECDESGRTLDLARVLVAIRALNQEDLTALLLSESLCPLHRVDYAICFDDDNPDCAAIRMIHPSHDT